MRHLSWAVLVVPALLAGCGDDDEPASAPLTSEPAPSGAESTNIRGEVIAPGGGCAGFTHFEAGDRLTVRSGEGEVLGVARLEDHEEVAADGGQCVQDFTVLDVGQADFYELSIAGEYNDPFTFTYDELEAADWEVELRFALAGGELQPSP